MKPRASENHTREAAYSVVPGNRVIQTGEKARIGNSDAHDSAHSTVELVRDGDLVKAIDVTCSCGEKTRIWCSYEKNS